MDYGSLISGIAATVDNVINGVSLGYNLYTNQRDFDYQKALQQVMFQREDTAVQRRMADLEAAGLNPNLAAGSAANAGSVVARSNTNDLNPGSLLDTVMALNQIKTQKKEQALLDSKIESQDMENTDARARLYYALGFNPQVSYEFGSDRPINFSIDGSRRSLSSAPLGELLQYQNDYNKNAADYMQKQNEWFVTNQIKDIVFDSVGAATDILKPNLKSYMKK